MSQDPKDKVYPPYGDYEELEVSFDDSKAGLVSALCRTVAYLWKRGRSGAIALGLLAVVGFGLFVTDNTWALFAITAVIGPVCFTTILIEGTRGNQDRESPRGADEPEDEPESPRPT